MAGPEAKIEREVVRLTDQMGIITTKWGVDGWPDRVFWLLGGRPFVIEFKSPGEEPNPRQAYRIECLKAMGYDVAVFDSVSHAMIAITRRHAEELERLANGTR
jgi:hypothetical protein